MPQAVILAHHIIRNLLNVRIPGVIPQMCGRTGPTSCMAGLLCSCLCWCTGNLKGTHIQGCTPSFMARISTIMANDSINEQ